LVKASPPVVHLFEKVLALGKNPALLITLMSLSLASFIVSIVGVPWFVKRLPEDYFSRREQERFGFDAPVRTIGDRVLVILKNAVGAVLVVAGVAMLVLPGQGILTLLVGVFMVDFPGKRRFQRRFLALPVVLKSVNALRERSGEPPLVVEFDEAVPSIIPPRSERPPRSVR
jgi:hypothetical protein